MLLLTLPSLFFPLLWAVPVLLLEPWLQGLKSALELLFGRARGPEQAQGVNHDEDPGIGRLGEQSLRATQPEIDTLAGRQGHEIVR